MVVAASNLNGCKPDGPDSGIGLGPSAGLVSSVTLAWSPSTVDADGAPLDDLAGYRLYFGTRSPLEAGRDTFVSVGLDTTYTISGLAPGTYYFATSAVDSSGNESSLSTELRAVLQP